MIEKYGLFDSLEGDEREYAEVDFARFCRALGKNGVRGGADALAVSAAASGLAVTVAPGLAMIEGRYYELEDDGSGEKALSLTAASANPRIDRIVLTLDAAARTIALSVLMGTEAASPVPPALVRNDMRHMLSLAQVRVPVGAGALTTANITDERADEAVCGLYVASADAAMAKAIAAADAASKAAPKHHAAADTAYGAGTGSSYGHVKLSDSVASSSAAADGVAATPKAVKSAYDKAAAAIPAVPGAKEGGLPVFDDKGNLAASACTPVKMELSGTTLIITTLA